MHAEKRANIYLCDHCEDYSVRRVWVVTFLISILLGILGIAWWLYSGVRSSGIKDTIAPSASVGFKVKDKFIQQPYLSIGVGEQFSINVNAWDNQDAIPKVEIRDATGLKRGHVLAPGEFMNLPQYPNNKDMTIESPGMYSLLIRVTDEANNTFMTNAGIKVSEIADPYYGDMNEISNADRAAIGTVDGPDAMIQVGPNTIDTWGNVAVSTPGVLKAVVEQSSIDEHQGSIREFSAIILLGSKGNLRNLYISELIIYPSGVNQKPLIQDIQNSANINSANYLPDENIWRIHVSWEFAKPLTIRPKSFQVSGVIVQNNSRQHVYADTRGFIPDSHPLDTLKERLSEEKPNVLIQQHSDG